MQQNAETPPLIAALHAQIQTIAARTIDIRMLVELEKTCLLARELMVLGQQPDAVRKHSLIGTNYVMGGSLGYDTYPMSSPFVGQQATSSPQETFGVTAIRELVSTLSSFMPKPQEHDSGFADLATAITTAKAAGDTELETQLREAMHQKTRSAFNTALPVMQSEGATP